MQLMGTVLETPINFKLSMYIVSPKHKPVIPLRLAKSSESVGKVAKSPSLPNNPKHARRKMVVDMLREILAEIGLASDNATLYKTGDMVQQRAAAKAAISPIIAITLALTLSERLYLLLIPCQKLIVTYVASLVMTSFTTFAGAFVLMPLLLKWVGVA